MGNETFGADAPPENVPDGQGSFTAPDGATDGDNLSADQVAALQQRDQHAQVHITKIETENAAMRTEMTALAAKVDQLGDVDSIMEKLNRVEGNSNVDIADVIAKAQSGVLDTLSSDAAEKLQTDNFKSVSDTLTAQYGDKTDEMVQKVCSEHNMSLDSMVALAKANPKAALALCKVETQIAPQGTAPSSINILGLQQQQAPVQTDAVGYDYATSMSEGQRIKIFMERMAKGA
jgi:hypothetical protein